MTPTETAPAPALVETIRVKLEHAPAPLKFKEVCKGLPRGKKVKPAEAEQEARRLLEEEVRLGRAFAYPSGKNGERRFWARDEKHLVREKALELAATPLALSALKTKVAKAVAGADGAFVELLLREMIGDGRLHEHAPKGKGAPLFGAAPPPPPPPWWEQAKHQAAVKKLAEACVKLLAAANAPAEELLQALRGKLATAPAAAARPSQSAASVTTPEPPPAPPVGLAPDLQSLILKAVANAPVVSLAELREEMPSEYQGRAFDEAVLRLADEQRVIINQDDNPDRFTEADRARYVCDGRFVFTTIAQWS